MTRSRLTREKHTVDLMIKLYCRKMHKPKKELCIECSELQAYAMQRLDKCPYQESKPSCLKCPIHCYKPEMREKMRIVMRYTGPRMLFYHPILTILHVLDERRGSCCKSGSDAQPL